jgi:hypothetical protein
MLADGIPGSPGVNPAISCPHGHERPESVTHEAVTERSQEMPELLNDGLPPRTSRTRFDFTEWADGQAWKFVRGADYDSATETFRMNVRKWAKVHGYEVELRPYPATDQRGEELPLTKADAVALGVRFVSANGSSSPPR